ncbi:MAG: sigma-70 family RNA polymerase sigma factor [Deltaproteobacteria bacterium]|nr:sigma-70 family RNA polymerase sigma factor [Deltaproteobacteria bacterium]
MQVAVPERPEIRPDEDAPLVERARAGDYGAFEALVRKHQRRVFAVAVGIVKNPAEAEEVVQETFLSAFEHLDGFRGESRFSTWIFRVASNHALMKLRKKRPEAVGDLADLEPSMALARERSEGTSPFDALSLWARRPDEAAAAHEVQAALEDALAALPEEERAMLLLRSIDDASHETLAETFGTTIPAVKSRLHRTRLLLRTLLDERLRGKPPP